MTQISEQKSYSTSLEEPVLFRKRALALVVPFFWIMLVFWGFSLFWWINWGYEESFLWFNDFHLLVLDTLSRYVLTHLGDGVILPALLILGFWKRAPGVVLTGILAILVTGLLAQLGKQVLFNEWQRPAAVFETNELVRIVFPNPPRSFSFPSGHATSMATGGVFFTVLLGFRFHWIGWATGIFTVLLCFTRVILGVHFPGDIFVGSVLGALLGLLILLFVGPILSRKYEQVGEDWKVKLQAGVPLIALLAFLFQFTKMIIRVW